MPKPRLRLVRLVVTLIVGIPVAVLLAWPQAFGAQTATIVSQLIAFRAALAVLLGVIALVFVAVAVRKRAWGIAAGIAIVLGAASVTNGVVLLERGGTNSMPDGELTVLAWNTEHGSASPEQIAQLVLDTDADIVSLPETDEDAAAEVARLLADEGRRMTVSTTQGETGYAWLPTSVLIAEELGEYRLDVEAGSTPGMPSGVWRSVDGNGPTIVAAHPKAPIPWFMDEWRAGLEWIAAQCDDPDVIVAGDLNATVDHLSAFGVGDDLIGSCQDAATLAGAAAIGTWPTRVPAWLGTPIDHVLVGSAWTVRGVEIITSFDGRASDHRPIVAVLDSRSG